MTKKSRVIFEDVEKSSITEDELNAWLEPCNQQKELFRAMTAWCKQAVEVLSEEGYSNFSTYGGTYKLTWHPQGIDSEASIDAQAADQVLRDIRFLHDAIFSQDKCRLANAGINLGLSIASAHSIPFETTLIRDFHRQQMQREAGRKSSKTSIGIRLKLSMIKRENPNFSATQAWQKLCKSAENNEIITSEDGVSYQLETDFSDTTQKVISIMIDTATQTLDGSGIQQSTLKKIYKKI